MPEYDEMVERGLLTVQVGIAKIVELELEVVPEHQPEKGVLLGVYGQDWLVHDPYASDYYWTRETEN